MSEERSIAFGMEDVCRGGIVIVRREVSRSLLASNKVSATHKQCNARRSPSLLR